MPITGPPSGGGGGTVTSVTAADSTITVGGTAAAPTLALGTVAESRITGLTTDLGNKSNVGHTHAESDVTGLPTDLANRAAVLGPSDHGFYTWTIDPAVASSSQALSAAGVMHLCMVRLPTAQTINAICLQVGAVGATMTNSYVALYDSTGTRRGVSADVSSSWTTTGFYAHALTSSYSATAGIYYLGILCGSAATIPSFSRNAISLVVNANLTAPGLRFGTIGSGLTAAPSTITLSSVTAATSATAVSYFMALK